MALLKSRKESQDRPASASPAETIDSLRRRARHRLIGAAILVLIGVIGFPILFDTQPRPVPVDIPIEIPDRTKAKSTPVNQPEPAAASASAAANAPASAAAAPTASAAPTVEPATAAVPEPAGKAADKPAVSEGLGPREEVVSAGATPKADGKPAAAAPAKDATKPDDGARAKALLEGKADPTSAGKDGDAQAERFVVQVGAYAEPDKARDVRQQLERAGLKTYTHVAETKEGRRIRVRVGPFPTKAEAERVAQKVKALGLPVAVLTL
jgi:DedD protein